MPLPKMLRKGTGKGIVISEEYKTGYRQGYQDGYERGKMESVKTSFWKAVKTDKSHYNYYCGHCNRKSEFRKSAFCPGCGYKMVEK